LKPFLRGGARGRLQRKLRQSKKKKTEGKKKTWENSGGRAFQSLVGGNLKWEETQGDVGSSPRESGALTRQRPHKPCDESPKKVYTKGEGKKGEIRG